MGETLQKNQFVSDQSLGGTNLQSNPQDFLQNPENPEPGSTFFPLYREPS